MHCQRPQTVIPCMNVRSFEVFWQCGYLWPPGCHRQFPNSTFQQQISLAFRPLCLLCIQPTHEVLNNNTRFLGCAKWVDGRLCRGNLIMGYGVVPPCFVEQLRHGGAVVAGPDDGHICKANVIDVRCRQCNRGACRLCFGASAGEHRYPCCILEDWRH